KFGSLSKIIAKIEKPSAVMRIEDIVNVSDGIMIARGDLGIEFPIEELPIIQKKFIKICIQKGKPVITATQMLESMILNPSPTRAEVTDVANAVLDGSDALMLSGETAIGNYPVESVLMMDKIIRKVESSLDYSKPPFRVSQVHLDINDSVAFAAYELAKFSDAKAIVAYTFSGDTARRVAKFRPGIPIVAITPNEFVASQLILSWGVIPVISEMVNSFEEMVNIARIKLKELNIIKELSKIVIIAGLPLRVPGNTNLIHLTDVH
ncbi:MAG: pyruvate kinase, partial [candidate division WOR-3 bacterium]